MPGYPLIWEDAASIDRLSDTCPYSLTEIADYLFRCHYDWSVHEEPTVFDVSGPHAQRQDVDRRYWLFEARKRTKREQQWFALVGTGKSPGDPSRKMRR